MVSLIITGHGNFATGLYSSMKLIAGDQEEVIAVDFECGQGSEDIKNNIKNAIDTLKSDNILILTDLAGGSPFNVCALLSEENKDKTIKVISGTNLPMLLEVALSKECIEILDLVELAKFAAKEGVKEYSSNRTRNEIVDEDGI